MVVVGMMGRGVGGGNGGWNVGEGDGRDEGGGWWEIRGRGWDIIKRRYGAWIMPLYSIKGLEQSLGLAS